ncbi:hypothetical protein [Pseudomonas fluorescens]|uniref:non-homologous end-joining DNA ligase LigD n=1 Tax=Pseudomonas fluorescens TaxID=294 RepID=UPI0039B4F6B3
MLPDRLTASSGFRNRAGTFFSDCTSLALGASTIYAYSALNRDGLPVSMPVFRDEQQEIIGTRA